MNWSFSVLLWHFNILINGERKLKNHSRCICIFKLRFRTDTRRDVECWIAFIREPRRNISWGILYLGYTIYPFVCPFDEIDQFESRKLRRKNSYRFHKDMNHWNHVPIHLRAMHFTWNEKQACVSFLWTIIENTDNYDNMILYRDNFIIA